MPTFDRTSRVPNSPEDAFAFVSDFRHAAIWDPAVTRAEKLTSGPIGLGTRYRLITKFPSPDLDYEIVEYDPPSRLALQGKTTAFSYRDEIDFVAADGGCDMTYNAKITLRGLLSIGNPILGIVFDRMGGDAMDGIVAALKAEAAG